MKYNFKKALVACGSLMMLAACSENTWNNDSLDGFEKPDLNAPDGSVVVDYTLTTADYKALATNVGANIAMATEAGELNALKAVGTQGYFTEVITAAKYLPAWMDSVAGLKGYPFAPLRDKATVVLAYRVAEQQPAEVTDIVSAPEYTVSEADYKAAYGSDENYAESFSPSYPASKYVPDFLAAQYPDANSGDFVYVKYNYSNLDPVFGGSGTGPVEDPEPVIAELEMGETYTLNGQLMAICTQGAALTTSTGTILLYNRDADWTSMTAGTMVSVEGVANNYYGALQLNGAVPTAKGEKPLTHPQVKKWTGADVDAWVAEVAAHKSTTPVTPEYIEVTGTLKISSGKYYNFSVDGATNQVAFWNPTDAQKATVEDGKTYTITGYAVSTGKTYINLIPTAVNGVAVAALPAIQRVAAVPSAEEGAVYKFDGRKWEAPSDILVLTAADYAAMGVRDLNATTAAQYLPIYMKQKFPYAKADDYKYVVYKFYNSSDKTTYQHYCDRMTFNGTDWEMTTVETKTAQFIRSNGKWIYDPTVYLNYPASTSDVASKAFYNACVKWVWDNICVKQLQMDNSIWTNWPQDNVLTSYGYVWGRNGATQEGYGGASAYYCNYDNRMSTFTSYMGDFNALYGEINSAELTTLTQTRFCKEVAPGAMSILYPDAMPGTDVDQYYEITFVQYSPKQDVTIKMLVTAKGTFKFVETSWEGITAE